MLLNPKDIFLELICLEFLAIFVTIDFFTFLKSLSSLAYDTQYPGFPLAQPGH